MKHDVHNMVFMHAWIYNVINSHMYSFISSCLGIAYKQIQVAEL